MSNIEFIKQARSIVCSYMLEHLSPDMAFSPSDDIFVVWLSKALQNNKALLATTIGDGMYYEITYNGDKNEFYLDAYKKIENRCIKAG